MNDTNTETQRLTAFGKAVQLHRLRESRSQFQVSVSYSGNTSPLSKIELGKSAPNLRTLWKLAEDLNVPLWKILHTAELFHQGDVALERELQALIGHQPKGRPSKKPSP